MDRIIKFRGQCAVSNDWVYGDLIHGTGWKKGSIYILPDTVNLATVKHCDPLDGVRVKPETVGQMVGLTDKKGVAIYEGDIMDYGNGRSFFIKYVGVQFVAAFNDRVINSIIPIHNFEVIGSIHTTPELIK